MTWQIFDLQFAVLIVMILKRIYRLGILVFLLGLSGSWVMAQQHLGGIKKTDTSDHLVTYEVQLVALHSETAADRLEAGLLDKQGFVSAEAKVSERRITLVVKPVISPADIADVLDYLGYDVAKTIDE